MAVEIKQPSPDKLKALQLAMEKIEKDHGRGTIMRLGDENIEEVSVIPTGSVGLNLALGVGGYPRGRIIEIYGPESSGKTTLAIHAIAEVQKSGGIAAIVDAEHAFDRFYAEKLGVDIKNLLISQPDSGEQALEVVDQLVRSSAVDLIVIDSVAALTPKAELEGDMGDSKVGLQARLMSQALRKLTASINKTNTTCIFINQLREKIGVMFGNPETTTGGNALKFYASVARHSPHRPDKRWRRNFGQPNPRESGEKQGGATVPQNRVRHYVRQWHLAHRRIGRFGCRSRHHQKKRFVV